MITITSSATPSVLAIIVTWNNKSYVLNLLDSIRNLDYPLSALDIVVVDNASNDGSAEAIAATHPHVKIIRNEENLGGTGGFNTGMAWALEQSEERYDYWWLLDNDVQVHKQALSKLVEILEEEADIGVAGSTMMQLDYPWRVNEMGCFVNPHDATLVLNRHLEEVGPWQGRQIEELLTGTCELDRILTHCQPVIDVDYVAATSLLVRPQIARQVGLWRDYFIHCDDVEWCLRIGQAGWRVVASARSLIWHMSGTAKVPTWILYYDHRNALDMLERQGVNPTDLHKVICFDLQKGIYLTLIGKPDLGRLLREAVEDFISGRLGKKAIQLDAPYRPNNEIHDVFMDPKVRRVLVSSAVDLHAAGIQRALIEALSARQDLQIEFMSLPNGQTPFQIPRQRFVSQSRGQGATVLPAFVETRQVRFGRPVRLRCELPSFLARCRPPVCQQQKLSAQPQTTVARRIQGRDSLFESACL